VSHDARLCTVLEQAATSLDQAAGNAPAESEAREAVNALALLTRLATTSWTFSWGVEP